MKMSTDAPSQNNLPIASMEPESKQADTKTTSPIQDDLALDFAMGLNLDYDDDSDLADCGDGEQADFTATSERPKGWAMATASALKKLVANAKGAASKPAVRFLQKNLFGTRLIFVVGQAGTGKSTILNEITGQSLKIGKFHKSGTKNHQVCPAIIDGEKYIFIDTAGFGAADIDDLENFHDIIACLDALGPFLTISGVLFVYGGNQYRMMKPDLTTIQWIKCFCGPEFYRNITVVTTKWDSLSEDDFEEAWKYKLPVLLDDPSLAEILEPPSVGTNRYSGGEVYHHGVSPGKGSYLAFLWSACRTDGAPATGQKWSER